MQSYTQGGYDRTVSLVRSIGHLRLDPVVLLVIVAIVRIGAPVLYQRSLGTRKPYQERVKGSNRPCERKLRLLPIYHSSKVSIACFRILNNEIYCRYDYALL